MIPDPSGVCFSGQKKIMSLDQMQETLSEIVSQSQQLKASHEKYRTAMRQIEKDISQICRATEFRRSTIEEQKQHLEDLQFEYKKKTDSIQDIEKQVDLLKSELLGLQPQENSVMGLYSRYVSVQRQTLDVVRKIRALSKTNLRAFKSLEKKKQQFQAISEEYATGKLNLDQVKSSIETYMKEHEMPSLDYLKYEMSEFHKLQLLLEVVLGKTNQYFILLITQFGLPVPEVATPDALILKPFVTLSLAFEALSAVMSVFVPQQAAIVSTGKGTFIPGEGNFVDNVKTVQYKVDLPYNAVQVSDIDDHGTYYCYVPKAFPTTRTVVSTVSEVPPSIASWVKRFFYLLLTLVVLRLVS